MKKFTFGVLAKHRSAARPAAPAGRVEKLTAGIPLAQLIKRRLFDAPEIVMLGKRSSSAAERFRRLKTLLAGPKDGPRVIVVTSAAPGDGKSFVALNLALAFAADQDDKVLLVDADLRRPTIDKWLTPPPSLGLSELLRTETELEHVVLTLENAALRVLPAGTPTQESVELLSSKQAQDLVTELRQRYDYIILDTPPIVPFTDADAIGAFSDGILMVARSGHTRRTSYQQALGLVNSTRILGTVLNDHVSRGGRTDDEQVYEEYYRRERKN